MDVEAERGHGSAHPSLEQLVPINSHDCEGEELRNPVMLLLLRRIPLLLQLARAGHLVPPLRVADLSFCPCVAGSPSATVDLVAAGTPLFLLETPPSAAAPCAIILGRCSSRCRGSAAVAPRAAARTSPAAPHTSTAAAAPGTR